MALKVGTLYAEMQLNKDGFTKGLSSAESNALGFSSKMSSIFAGIGMAIGMALAQAAAKVAQLFPDMANAASNLNEEIGKVTVVFGANAKAILAWSKDSATTMEMSQRQALQAVGSFGALFTAMKMAPAASMDMSKSLVQLAGDLSSFYNIPIEEALQALRSGMVGETEPLRQFGVMLNETTIGAKAMAMGLWDGKGVIDASAKSQAAYALIMEQTKVAQGDVARTSSEMAGQQRITGATIEDTMAKVGAAFTPIVKTILPIFNGMLIAFGDWVTVNLPAIQAAFATFTADLGARLTDVMTRAAPLIAFLQQLWAQIQLVVAQMVAWLQEGTNLQTILTGLAVTTAAMLLPLAALVAAVVIVVAGIAELVSMLNQAGVFEQAAQLATKAMSDAFAQFKKDVLPGLIDTLNFITKEVLPPLIDTLNTIWKAVLPALVAYVQAGFAIMRTEFDWLKVAFGYVVEYIKFGVSVLKTEFDVLKAAIGFIVTVFEGLKTGVRIAWDGITSATKTAVNLIIDAVNVLITALDAIKLPAIPNPLGGGDLFGGWPGFQIPLVKHLSKGTLDWQGGPAVVHENGPEAIFLPAHSAVIPANETAAMIASRGDTYQIYGVTADDVERAIKRNRRRAALGMT